MREYIKITRSLRRSFFFMKGNHGLFFSINNYDNRVYVTSAFGFWEGLLNNSDTYWRESFHGPISPCLVGME